MSSGLRGSKLKQALFNSHGGLNRDWRYLAELCDKNEAWEKKIMFDFYLGFEGFISKQDVYDFYNPRPYLEKYPELKEKIIKTVLKYIDNEENGGEE
jgi:hypothetical protein